MASRLPCPRSADQSAHASDRRLRYVPRYVSGAEPYNRQLSEFLLGQFFERYRFCGPRGLAMVPVDQAHRLSECVLPEAELYDQLYAIQDELVANRRAAAQQLLDAIVRLPHASAYH